MVKVSKKARKEYGELMDQAIGLLMKIPFEHWEEVFDWAQIGVALADRKKEIEAKRSGSARTKET